MSDASEDRIHPATPRRRREAREQGQIARSQDLATAGFLLGSLATLFYFGSGLATQLTVLMRNGLSAKPWLSTDVEQVVQHFNDAALGVGKMLLPFFVLGVVWGILSTILQIGLMLRPERLAPQWDRVSPLAGLRRLFSAASPMRGLFAIAKIAAVGGVVFYCVRSQGLALAGSAALPPPQIVQFVGQFVIYSALKVAGTLLAIGLVDYGFQWWQNERQMKMTTQEMRDELRDLQGDPQAVGQRRALGRQLMAVGPADAGRGPT